MTNRTAKGSTLTAVIVIAVVLIGLGVAYYLASDVFRTRVNSSADQYTRWTPENIAKDPVNYLNFAEAETKQALEDLKANEIAIAQNRAKLETMRSDAAQEVSVGERTLDQLKETYREAETANAFPVQWQGAPRDSDFMKRQIMALHKQVETQRSLQNKVDGGLKKLDVQSNKVQEARGQAQEQLADINANRELLKVEKITGDLTERLVAMKGTLQATVATASETTGLVSLDQLATEAESTVDETEFDRIMSGA